MPTRLTCAGMHAHASLGNLHGEMLLLGGSGPHLRDEMLLLGGSGLASSFFDCVGYFDLESCLSPIGIGRRLLAVGRVFFSETTVIPAECSM